MTPAGQVTIAERTAEILKTAREIAVAQAQGEMDDWFEQMKLRIDEYFIPWYFSFWRQQWWGVIGVSCSIRNGIFDAGLTSKEAINLRVIEGFKEMVLEPAGADRRMNRILTRALVTYLSLSRAYLSGIPEEFEISRSEWDSHLAKMATITQRAKGDREVAVPQKCLSGFMISSIALTPKMLDSAAGKMLRKPTRRVAGKLVARLSGRFMTGTLGKMIGKVGARLGGKALGWYIAAGIVVWDIVDHEITKSKQTPILRRNLDEYLDGLREQLLHSPDSPLQEVFLETELEVVNAIGSFTGELNN